MKYDMGEPSDLPGCDAATSVELSPTGQLFRWRGSRGEMIIGRAIMEIGTNYLMYNDGKHYLVPTHLVELHPMRSEWENTIVRHRPIYVDWPSEGAMILIHFESFVYSVERRHIEEVIAKSGSGMKQKAISVGIMGLTFLFDGASLVAVE